GAGVGLAAAALVALGATRDRAGATCTDGERELAGVWDAAARFRLATSFAASPLPYALPTWRVVQRELDRYAGDLARMSEQACRTSRDGTHPAELVDPHPLCLGLRRRSLARTVEALADPAALERAPMLVRDLPAIADCADPAHLAALAGTRTNDARAELPTIEVALVIGHEREASPRVERVLAAARDSGDRALEAQALLLRGRIEAQTREPARAVATFGEAIELAGQASDARTRIDAWLELGLALQAQGKLDEAEAPLALAQRALRDAPDPRREGKLEIALGTLAGRRSKFAEALTHFESALAHQRVAFGDDSPGLVATLTNMALARRRMGEQDEAARLLGRAYELASALGADHPSVLGVRRDQAMLLLDRGDREPAVAMLREVLASRIRQQPEGNLNVALAHDDVAVAVAKLGDYETALAEHQAGLAIRERLAPDAPETWNARAQVAVTLGELGRAADAEPVLRAVLAAHQRRFGRVHHKAALVTAYLGDVLAALGRHAEAVQAFRDAQAIYAELFGPTSEQVAKTLVAEAEIERARGRAKAALRLDEQALKIREASRRAHDPGLVRSLIAVAEDQLALRQLGDATKLAERALAAAGEARGVDGAHARWVLARALVASHRDRARALELARDARARLAEVSGADARRELAELDAWLAAFPAR
ncbi:MAG TPA: tetratricopeptide repeat protein, partial [Kofleriaceae bacterium]|nr:tetratricopeptide repeat protein [Kofleriaceae bacterium]